MVYNVVKKLTLLLNFQVAEAVRACKAYASTTPT